MRALSENVFHNIINSIVILPLDVQHSYVVRKSLTLHCIIAKLS